MYSPVFDMLGSDTRDACATGSRPKTPSILDLQRCPSGDVPALQVKHTKGGLYLFR